MYTQILASIKHKPISDYRTKNPLFVIGTMYNVLNKHPEPAKYLSPEVREMMCVLEDNKDIPCRDFLQKYRKALYHDDAIRLHKEDILNTNFYDKPVFTEHDGVPVGKIISVSFTGDISSEVKSSNEIDNDLLVLVKITDQNTINAICDKKFTAFSVGYKFIVDKTGKVIEKQFNEVSVVEKPFFKGCTMNIVASKTLQEKNNQKPVNWEHILKITKTIKEPLIVSKSTQGKIMSSAEKIEDEELKKFANDPAQLRVLLKQYADLQEKVNKVQDNKESEEKEKKLQSLQQAFKNQNAGTLKTSIPAIRAALGLKEEDSMPSQVEKLLDYCTANPEAADVLKIFQHYGTTFSTKSEMEQKLSEVSKRAEDLSAKFSAEMGNKTGEKRSRVSFGEDTEPEKKKQKTQNPSSAFDSRAPFAKVGNDFHQKYPEMGQVGASGGDDDDDPNTSRFITTEERQRRERGEKKKSEENDFESILGKRLRRPFQTQEPLFVEASTGDKLLSQIRSLQKQYNEENNNSSSSSSSSTSQPFTPPWKI